MPTIITGGRGTAGILAARRKLDVAEEIALLQPDAAPLTVILMRMGKQKTINPKFDVFEDDLLPRRDQINNGSGYTSGDTDVVVDNGSYWAVRDVVKNERTKEIYYITVVSSNTLTITRAWGETSAAAIVDGDWLIKLGNSSEEGATIPTVKSTLITDVYNYCQDFRTPVEVTDILANSELYGPADLDHQRKVRAIDHRVSIENAFFFGERKLDTSGTHPKRGTRGLEKWITTNVTTDTALTEIDFDSFLEGAINPAHGPTGRVLFASPLIVSALSYWAKGSLIVTPKDKTYGITVLQYLSPHGTINIVKHPLLTGTTYGGFAFLCKMDNLKYRYLQNMDTKLLRNRQANDATKETDEYETVCGLGLKNEPTFAILKGVASYS
jgi:hypothetical protein